MRKFRQILFIVLALLPVVPLLLYAFGNIGNVNGVDFSSFGVIDVLDDGLYSLPDNFWGTYLSDLGVNNEGAFFAVNRGFVNLLDSVGLPVSVPSVMACYIFAYEFLIYLLDLLVSVLTWVIRKVGAILE